MQAPAARSSVDEHFESVASSWSERYRDRPSFKLRLRAVAEALDDLQLSAGATVLDFGGGCGVLSMLATSRAAKVVCLEPSAAMLAAGQAHVAETEALVAAVRPGVDGGKIEWRQGDEHALTELAPVFDAVLAISVLEYLQDPAATSCRLAEVLRPGGHLICTIPDMRAPLRRVEPVVNALASAAARVVANRRLIDRAYATTRPTGGYVEVDSDWLRLVRERSLAVGSGPLRRRIRTMHLQTYQRR